MSLPQQQQQSHTQQQQQQLQKKDMPQPGHQMGHQSSPSPLQNTSLPTISQVQGSSVSTSNASLLNTSSMAEDSSSVSQLQTALTQSESNRSEQTVIGSNSNASKLLSVPTGENVSSSPKPFDFDKSETAMNDSGLKSSIKPSDLSEPTSSNIKPEEPSSTTSPKENNDNSETKPDSSSAFVDSSFGKAGEISEKSTCSTPNSVANSDNTQQQSMQTTTPTSNNSGNSNLALLQTSEPKTMVTTAPSTIGTPVSQNQQHPVDQQLSSASHQTNSVTNHAALPSSLGPNTQIPNSNLPPATTGAQGHITPVSIQQGQLPPNSMPSNSMPQGCLLYTSDAADE